MALLQALFGCKTLDPARLLSMTTFFHKIARTTAAGLTPEAPAPEPLAAKDTLVDVVLQVVADADWSQPDVDGRLGRTRTACGEVLLATLTYCYASGLYNSSNIATALLRNRNNSELLNRMPLDRNSFSQFRRHNRDLLKTCLTQVLGLLGRPTDADHHIARAVETDFMDSDE